MSATVLPLGAALVGLRLGASPRNLVLEYATPNARSAKPTSAGALVGPVANRIRDGLAEIDGQTYQMPLNENGQTSLHSGPDGLHAQLWQVAKQHPHAVTFTCTLPDGTNGLPGTRHFTATYSIAETTLTLHITATTDRTTPINVASHPYWNLDGAPDITGHTLQVAAQSYLPTDAMNLPTGEIAPLHGTAFDFTTPRRLSRDPALDLNFCLAHAPRATPQPAATLRGSDGTTLEIATTAPGLQVYAGSNLMQAETALAGNPVLAPYAGVALEPQLWPDALFHKPFPAILLRTGETWEQTTLHRFTAP